MGQPGQRRLQAAGLRPHPGWLCWEPPALSHTHLLHPTRPASQLKKEWKEGDTMLLDLMPFLEAVVRTHVSGRGLGTA